MISHLGERPPMEIGKVGPGEDIKGYFLK